MLKNKFKKERIPLVSPEVEYHREKHGKRRLSMSSAAGTDKESHDDPSFFFLLDSSSVL